MNPIWNAVFTNSVPCTGYQLIQCFCFPSFYANITPGFNIGLSIGPWHTLHMALMAWPWTRPWTRPWSALPPLLSPPMMMCVCSSVPSHLWSHDPPWLYCAGCSITQASQFLTPAVLNGNSISSFLLVQSTITLAHAMLSCYWFGLVDEKLGWRKFRLQMSTSKNSVWTWAFL